MNKVKYYSNSDLMTPYHLKQSEELISQFDKQKSYSINELLELYNVRKYIINNCSLKTWNEQYINNTKILMKDVNSCINKSFNKLISNETVLSVYKGVDIEYQDDFFEILSSITKSSSIDDTTFERLLDENETAIEFVVNNKELVTRYDKIIKDYLMKNPLTACPIILNKYIVDSEAKNIIAIPKSMSIEDKEKIINDYLDNENSNIIYINLIISSQNSDKLLISGKTKLKAVKKREVLEKELLKNAQNKFGFTFGAVFDNEQSDPKKVITDNKSIIHSYSRKWIANHLQKPTILNNFIFLFEYVDRNNVISLCNRKVEDGIFDKINIVPSRSYNVNKSFKVKECLSDLEIKEYYNYLSSHSISLENIIKWFFMDYLKEEFNIYNYCVSIPPLNNDYFEKCKSIIPEIDRILKEYKCYCDNGEIDYELIEISSDEIKFEDIPSIVEKKYVYVNNDISCNKIDSLITYLFDSQCLLNFNIKIPFKYNTFYEQITKEKTRYSDYNEASKPHLVFLKKEGIIQIENDIIEISNTSMVRICYLLHQNGVINYWRCSDEDKRVIESEINNGYLIFGNTLLSKQEQEYFSYYLNRSYFCDGYDIRNKYVHGTKFEGNNTNEHRDIYFVILKILILMIIKINDELRIKFDVIGNSEICNNDFTSE